MELATFLILVVGVLQIPLLIDLWNGVFPRYRIPRATRRCIGALLALFVVFVLVASLVYFFLVFPPPESRRFLYTTLALWLWTNTMSCYISAVLIDPGTLEKVAGAETRPTTYCSITKQRVLYMDHYCPFTMTAIGLRNYRFYYLFLVYVLLGISFAGHCCFEAFVQCRWSRERADEDYCFDLGTNSITFLPVTVGWCSMGTLLLFQTFLLLGDMSTRDFLRQLGSDPPSLAICLGNIRCGRALAASDSRLNLLLLKSFERRWHFFLPIYPALQLALSTMSNTK